MVSGIHDVPDKVRKVLHIVSVNSWQEAKEFVSGKERDVAMFWSAGVPADRLLKTVEDYRGNLLVYSEADVGPAMRSRFTRVMRGKRRIEWQEMGKPSAAGVLLEQVKKSMF